MGYSSNPGWAISVVEGSDGQTLTMHSVWGFWRSFYIMGRVSGGCRICLDVPNSHILGKHEVVSGESKDDVVPLVL